MPTSGARRLRSTSTPSALSGEMYRTRVRPVGLGRRGQLVERPQERRQGLAGAGGCHDERVRPARDRVPRPELRGRRRVEGTVEPLPGGRGEAVEDGVHALHLARRHRHALSASVPAPPRSSFLNKRSVFTKNGRGGMETLKMVLELVVVLGAIVMGTRSSGVALGLWGGAGVAVLVFVFGEDVGARRSTRC